MKIATFYIGYVTLSFKTVEKSANFLALYKKLDNTSI